MTKEEFLSGKPFWYTGHFQRMQHGSPISISENKLTDKDEFVVGFFQVKDMKHNYVPDYLQILTREFGIIIVDFKECSLTDPYKK